MATLFSQRIDLAEGHTGVTLYNRSRNQDTYTVGFSSVTIKHSAKRGAPELVESDPVKGNLYIAGDAYDTFDVWTQVRTADSTRGVPGLSKCIAEDCTTFDEAISAAYAYLSEAQ